MRRGPPSGVWLHWGTDLRSVRPYWRTGLRSVRLRQPERQYRPLGGLGVWMSFKSRCGFFIGFGDGGTGDFPPAAGPMGRCTGDPMTESQSS